MLSSYLRCLPQFQCGAEEIRGVEPTHWKDKVDADENCGVRWERWGNVSECAHIRRLDVTPVKGVHYVPFGLEYGAVRGVSAPDVL